MNILMISRSVYETDVRVRREAETLVEAGNTVEVVCLSGSGHPARDITLHGVSEPTGLTPVRPQTKGLAYRFLRWLLLPSHRSRALRQFEQAVERWVTLNQPTPDVVHAHDFPALQVSARLARSIGCKLVYDSHEVWSGMDLQGRPSPVRRRREAAQERTQVEDADVVLTVSEGAARALEDTLAIDAVRVIRNTFPSSNLSPPVAEPTGLIYAGRVARGRDLGTLLSAGRMLDSELELHLVGPTDGSVDVSPPAILHAAVRMDELERMILGLGISVISLERGSTNHAVALPNKLFQAVALAVPVVAANLPEMGEVVTRFGLGELYEPGEAASLADAARKVVASYSAYRDNTLEARRELTWEVDSGKLLQAYETVTPA